MTDLSALEALYLAALELPPAGRSAFLDGACRDHPGLRARVEELLAAHPHVGGFLEPPAGATASVAPEGVTATAAPAAPGGTRTVDHPGRDESVGSVVAGKYKLVEAIGEGGMGSVFLAQQTEPVRRLVAVKVIKAGMDSRAVLARFDAERQALAMMDHPNIARVLDAGTTETGRPFFVMELVKGVPITRFCDERKLTPRQRLELFVPVCQAIQHAHQKGIIHRDIKPSNVLVALYDDRPVPKVIDFGVAKATGPQLTEYTLVTGLGAVVGTPEYMSPEQASFNNLDVDTRSDIYSLGVLLYELLTGTTPIDRKSLGRAALLEILRIVREVEAPRPSTKLSTSDALPSISANRSLEPARLTRLLRGELDWIVMKALEKDRSRRYETANGFAADVQRYLAGEQVQAVPPSAGYRLRKFLRKHRGPVVAASVVLVALVAGVVGTGWGLVEARRQRDDADGQRRDAETARALEAEQRGKVEEREKLLERQKTLLEERTKEADAARDEAAQELHDNNRTMLSQAWEGSENAKLRNLLERMRPKPGRPDFRGFETHYLDRLTHPEIDCARYQLRGAASAQEVPAQHSMPGRVRFNHTLATNQHYFSIDALDLLTGKPAAGFAPIRGRWTHPQFGRFVSLVSGEPPRIYAAGHLTPSTFVTSDLTEANTFQLPQQEIRVWDARTGRELARCERLTPDERLTAQGWRHRFGGSGMRDLAETLSRGDSSRVMTQMVRRLEAAPGVPVAFESRLLVHDLTTGRVVRTLDARPGFVERAYFSFDDKYIVTSHRNPRAGGGPDRFTAWDAATGREMWSREANFKGFTIDGEYVGFDDPAPPPAAGTQPPMKVHRLDTGEAVELPRAEPLFPHPLPADDMWRDGNSRLKRASARPERLWGTLGNLPTSPTRQWLDGRGDVVALTSNSTQVQPDQDRVETVTVTTCRPARVDVYPYPGRTSPSRTDYRHTPAGTQLVATGTYPHAFCLAAALLATTGDRQWWLSDSVSVRWVETLDLETGSRAGVVLDPQPAEGSMSVVRGGTVLVQYGPRHEYDFERERNSLWQWILPRPPVPAFIVFDLRTGRRRFTHLASWGTATSGRYSYTVATRDVPVSLSPDGTSIAMVAPVGRELRLLDAETGNPRWTAPLPLALLGRQILTFSPDGTRVMVAGTASRTILVLDAASGGLLRQIDDVIETPDKPEVAVGAETCRVSPDGLLMLLTSSFGDLTVVDPAAGTVRHRIARAKASTPNPTVYTPPPAWLLGPEQFSDRFVLRQAGTEYEVWDYRAGTLWSRFDLKPVRGVNECRFSGDGSRLFVLDNDVVHVIDLRRGREVLRIPRGTLAQRDPAARPLDDHPSHISLSADGTELTVCTAYPEWGTVARRVYDGRPLTPDELARAERIREIQNRPLPPPAPIVPADKKPPVTASDYFDRARRPQGADPKGIIADYREAIKLDPEFAVLHGHLARALENSGDPDGALAAYRETVRLAPRDLDSHWRMGLILERRGDYAGAAAAHREALRNDTRNGALDAGVEVFTGNFPPSRAVLLNALAYALRELGELDAAEREFREAIRLEPASHWFVTNLALCLIRNGKLKEAGEEMAALIKPFEERARKAPKNQELARQLAQTTLDVGAMYLWEHCHEDAARWNARATELFTDYFARFPNDFDGKPIPDTQKALRWSHWNHSVALHWGGRSAEAIAELDLALKYIPDPEKPNDWMLRVRYVAKTGDHMAAAARIAELLEKPQAGDSLRWLYWNAALGYARCAAAVKGDQKLSTEYADKAIAMLRKAVAEGVDYGVFRGKTDPDIDPIRDRADFKKLAAELERKFLPPRTPAPPPRERK